MVPPVCIPCFGDNYSYLLPEQNSAILVDPCQARPILRVLQLQDIRGLSILITHYHADHIAGLAEIQAAYPDAQVYGPPPTQNGQEMRNFREVAPDEEFFIGEVSIRSLFTPGHSPDDTCYLVGEQAFFSGDVLFMAGCGRVFSGSNEQMYHSLQKIIACVDPEVAIYFGHEYSRQNLQFAQQVEPENAAIVKQLAGLQTPSSPTTLAVELQINPFLRSEHPQLIAQAAARTGVHAPSPAQVFSAIRNWKNTA